MRRILVLAFAVVFSLYLGTRIFCTMKNCMEQYHNRVMQVAGIR